ncbi:hypothetical protein [Agrobacterium sp. ST15.13.015]|uniref:hypothetical protein n=1 Tax=Agrobacterium sp. ST15.13.015 TaxID=3017319 RepID=UPI0022C8E608|nr:hypothetical protein [Agrobacterium sp. ST15.13.015]MCZ7502981.1 hypothetical protein [Rhizobium rhizogenes]
MDEDWISITEAAARLTQSGDKVDRSTLSRYLKQHAEALPLREGGKSNKVDYIALVEHRSGNIRIRSAPAGTLFSSVASPAPASGSIQSRNKTQADGSARKALAEAELKEMDLAKRRGELTTVDEVDQAGRDAVALMQSAFERAIEPEAATLSLKFGWDERTVRLALKGFAKLGLATFNEQVTKQLEALKRQAEGELLQQD